MSVPTFMSLPQACLYKSRVYSSLGTLGRYKRVGYCCQGTEIFRELKFYSQDRESTMMKKLSNLSYSKLLRPFSYQVPLVLNRNELVTSIPGSGRFG